MEKLKYNYVIFGSTGYYLAGYNDIIGHPNVYYIQEFYQGFGGLFNRIIVKLFYSEKVNKIVKTPFAFYVFPRIFRDNFREKRPLCFVFFEHWHRLINSTYISYIRRNYPNAKIIIYLQDLVDKSKGIDIEYLKNKMDLIITYDKGESLRYKIDYYPTPMSYVRLENTNHLSNSDFYFCGKPKERYKIIKNLYILLTEKGYICDFIIIGNVDNEDKIEGMRYQTSPFDYFENLAHVSKTKCVVEVMQEGASGYTPRLWESILNDKHLLTNNVEVLKYDNYDCRKIHLLNDDTLKDLVWVNAHIAYDKNVKEALSPLHFLEYVEKRI